MPASGSSDSIPAQLFESDPRLRLPSDRDAAAVHRAPAELSLRVARPLANYVRDHHGEDVLEHIARAAGLKPRAFTNERCWVSNHQLERFFAGVRALVPDDDTFRNAAAYGVGEGYGKLRYVLWAVSPTTVLELAARNMSMISSISDMKIIERARDRLVVRYYSDRPESRLACLCRQAQGRALPMLWGLPRAEVVDRECLGQGDPYCEYHIRFYQQARWLPPLVGLAVGGIAAASIGAATGLSPLSLLFVPLLGAMVGYIAENRRTMTRNLAHANEMHEAMKAIAGVEAESRREIMELHRRERRWARALEEKVARRTRSLTKILDQIRQFDTDRKQTLRTMSHDLRNPLTFLRAECVLLRDHIDPQDASAIELLQTHEEAVMRMEALLNDLGDVAREEATLMANAAEPIRIDSLTATLRARLEALARDRDLQTQVICTHEAPAEITTDPEILDRIMDNLLSSAIRQTRKGSVVVELDGQPGYLTMQICDSGPGFDTRNLQGLDSGRYRDLSEQQGWSLPLIAQLLDQIEGKLELMSTPGEGTTFWVHLPLSLPLVTDDESSVDDRDEVLARVVKIRTQ